MEKYTFADWPLSLAAAMSNIAIELDTHLKSLGRSKAAVLEQLVRDAIELTKGDAEAPGKPETYADFIRRIAGSFAGEELERPEQGKLERREVW